MRRATSLDRYQARRSRSSCRMRPWTSIACSAKAPITFAARSGTSSACYTVDIVSVTSGGIQGNNLSRTLNFAHYLLSQDGRFVYFYSFADNLVAGGSDTNGAQD